MFVSCKSTYRSLFLSDPVDYAGYRNIAFVFVSIIWLGFRYRLYLFFLSDLGCLGYDTYLLFPNVNHNIFNPDRPEQSSPEISPIRDIHYINLSMFVYVRVCVCLCVGVYVKLFHLPV